QAVHLGQQRLGVRVEKVDLRNAVGVSRRVPAGVAERTEPRFGGVLNPRPYAVQVGLGHALTSIPLRAPASQLTQRVRGLFPVGQNLRQLVQVGANANAPRAQLFGGQPAPRGAASRRVNVLAPFLVAHPVPLLGTAA